MEITDGAAWAIGAVGAALAGATGWLYARIGGVHKRIDGVVNHMTQEDNKLHARIDTVREQYVRRDDLDARLLRLEAGQDKLLEKFDEFANSSRHNLKNVEQIVTRLDERVKHLEG
jgi:hypothetical protein